MSRVSKQLISLAEAHGEGETKDAILKLYGKLVAEEARRVERERIVVLLRKDLKRWLEDKFLENDTELCGFYDGGTYMCKMLIDELESSDDA